MSTKDKKAKKKRGLFHFTGKSKKKKKKSSDADAASGADDIATKDMPTKPSTDTIHNQHTDDSKMGGNNGNNNTGSTEIDLLVDKMKSILSKLAALNHKSHHSIDIERFHKLVAWVDYNESHLALLEEAWNDSSFWPFLSTPEATEQVRQKKATMLIRLSNTKPGAITVTRLAKNHIMEDYVKHKRFSGSEQFGRLTLTGSWGERSVTWHGLLSYLKQKECCICLEELSAHNPQNTSKQNVLRLNCGHHFHRHCIERHVSHSRQMNGTAFAVCPLCRKRIENAELINEPSLMVYQPTPDIMAKSKSCDTPMNNRIPLDEITRAKTADLTKTADLQKNTDNMDDATDELMLQLISMQQGQMQENHPWNAHVNQIGNHLNVGRGSLMDDDDYSSAAQVRKQYKNMNMNGNHHI